MFSPKRPEDRNSISSHDNHKQKQQTLIDKTIQEPKIMTVKIKYNDKVLL